MKGQNMRQSLFGIFTLFIGLSLTIGIYAQEKEKTEKKESTKEVQKEIQRTSAQKVDDGKPVNTVCPVSGEDVDPEVIYVYNGKTYALCCNKCLKKFKADPEKYISRLNSSEKPDAGLSGKDKK
jgi:YHS domain-containing protein